MINPVVNVTHPDGTQYQYRPSSLGNIWSGGVVVEAWKPGEDGKVRWVSCVVPRGRLSEAIHRHNEAA